jgi:molecular chaperone GrpE
MNSEEQKSAEALDELAVESVTPVDDFIRELEAKEKDLHITADLQIEIADSDFTGESIPEFIQQELASSESKQGASPIDESLPAGSKTRIYELEKEVEILKARIDDLRADRNEIQEKSDRRLKDFENYKYRMDRERRGAFIDQISNLASQMLPVLDNLDRALQSVENLEAERSVDFQQFYDGIGLVNQQVNEIFAEMGVQPIETVGQIFDPNLHEAVAVEERDELPGNTITEEMLRGYRIGNRVIRHSMVKVTTSPIKDVPETYRFSDPQPSSDPSTEDHIIDPQPPSEIDDLSLDA